jgi:hypothetical protein
MSTESSKRVKVVHNGCYGGFSFSKRARDWLAERGLPEAVSDAERDPKCSYGGFRPYDTPRHHPLLVECVETLGREANGSCAELEIAEVANVYRIDEYDGVETVMEPDGYDWIDGMVLP